MPKDLTALYDEVRGWADEEIYHRIHHASPAIPPPEFETLLMVAGQRPVVALIPWFTERLENIIGGQSEGWNDIDLNDIVRAAASVMPGRIETFRHYWLVLLGHPKFSTLAYGSLIRNQDECLAFLQKWWSVTQSDKSARLHQIFQHLFDRCDARDRNNGNGQDHRQALKARIESFYSRWDPSLVTAVKTFLNHGRHR